MDYDIARHYAQANHCSVASLKFWGTEIKYHPLLKAGAAIVLFVLDFL